MSDYWDGNVWVCEDCYMAHHGVADYEMDDERRAELGARLVGCDTADNTCSNHDGTDELPCEWCGQHGFENGINEFSWERCDGCGSNLGGSRHRLAYKVLDG